MRWFLIPIILLLTITACSDSKLTQQYVGQKIPYSKLGSAETLEGTTNNRWVAYFQKENITIISDKKTDLVLAVYEGKQPQ